MYQYILMITPPPKMFRQKMDKVVLSFSASFTKREKKKKEKQQNCAEIWIKVFILK